MHYFITETLTSEEGKRNASSKARDDVGAIMSDLGWEAVKLPITSLDRAESGILRQGMLHIKAYQTWKKAVSMLKSVDALLIQFPPREHTIFLSRLLKRLHKSGVRIFLLIHDIETVRSCLSEDKSLKFKLRSRLEELSCIDASDIIIVHNHAMARFLIEERGVAQEKIVELKIFDYLIPGQYARNPALSRDFRSVIVAGNLSPQKAAYLYELPEDLKIELYGLGYEGKASENIHYNGAFLPEELPSVLRGGFGLVWDGDSADTCGGVYGAYMRYNNPHKTSLYLACGIPVIIWEEAALARFVRDNGCGITIGSLTEISDILKNMTKDEYMNYSGNASSVGAELRKGVHTREAVDECLRRADEMTKDAEILRGGRHLSKAGEHLVSAPDTFGVSLVLPFTPSSERRAA